MSARAAAAAGQARARPLARRLGGRIRLSPANATANGSDASPVQHALYGLRVTASVKNPEGGVEPAMLFPRAEGRAWASGSALQPLDGNAYLGP